LAIKLSVEQNEEMRQHAASAYPHECCGFLLGKVAGDVKCVERIIAATNTRDDSPQNRYLIDPKEFMMADREARKGKLDIVGIYHSHPDHPARPSDFDRDHAWPFYSYIIYSVERGVVADARSWLLDEDRSAFSEEPAENLA